MGASGKLEKMTIYAYSKPDFSSQVGSKFSVMINPNKYTHNHSISYNKETAQGAPGSSIKFDRIQPETVGFEFTLDATGVISSSPINDQIKTFKSLVYDYNGKVHESNYIVLSWGTLYFKCRLTKLDLTYTLFKPDGTPLRATVNVSFEEYTDARTLALEANKNSPDLTHERTVKSGDTLPLMCYRIYGSPAYYMDVAQANQLDDFRSLKPGQVLYFPPIDK
ncbi:LysM peptidoglycan-binding domain-containing protein [bacterium SCSIO 12741]|nr:LysM peptidoglycan-binding domain-containing protein [bacterium SCSIO 12741]